MNVNSFIPAIRELTLSDEIIINRIAEIQDKYNKKENAYYFLYQETNIKANYRELLYTPDDKVFYACHPDTNEILGFAHFKIIENSIFLDNILIDSDTFEQTILQLLLIRSVEEISRVNESITVFELDVFEKNKRLFNLYLSLGMEISSYCYWYDITNYCTIDFVGDSLKNYASCKSLFQVLPDQKDSKLLFYNDVSIGTLIKDKYLIIRSEIDYLLFKKISFFFKDTSLESVCMVSKKALELFLVDKSFHLAIPLKELEAVKLSV